MRSRSFLGKKCLFISAILLTLIHAWRSELQAQSASLRLGWTDTSDNEDGFKIDRLLAGLLDKTITTGPQSTSYTDSGLVAGTIYCYRVRAFNSAGESDASNQACAAAHGSGNNGSGGGNDNQKPVTLSVSPTNVAPSAKVSASWSGISNPSYMDWIGLYAPGDADTKFINWIYVSCSKAPAGGSSSGSCPFVIPSKLSAGTYELRLFADDGYTRLANSSTLSVSTGSVARLTVSPTSVARSAKVSASWSGISNPSYMDWIGLYAPGDADTKFINWIYVSCSKAPAGGSSSGSCPFVIPSKLSAGTYELRLFADDGYERLATSAPISLVSAKSGLARTGSNGGGASRSQVQNPSTDSRLRNVLSTNGNHGAQLWSDYQLTVKLQSMDDDAMGVMFRYQDQQNYYRFSWETEYASRRLVKLENGVLTVLAEDTVPYETGQAYELQIVAQGTTLTVVIDGAPIFSATDTSFNSGTIALYSSFNEGSIFDDVLVQDLATGAVLLSVDFNNDNFDGWIIVDDEGTRLGPSVWSAASGALVQSSNIGSDAERGGTFALYSNDGR